MMRVDEAQALIKREMRTIGRSLLPIEEANGRVMAEKLRSPLDMPPFDRSAMDGYAVRYDDLRTTREIELIGRADAGHGEPVAIGPGQGVRIHTGAMIPEGADTVIRQEDVDVTNGQVRIDPTLQLKKGANLRPRGEELLEGDLALESATRLRPAGIAFLASLGIKEVPVHRRPRIALLYSGDELTPPGEELQRGNIYESNTYGIEALLKENDHPVEYKAHLPDDPEASREHIEKALGSCELLLLSGGISVGDRDHVKQALLANGIEEGFHKVDQKPGKPIFFGIGNGQYAFGLPGNPAASLVGIYEYALPFLKGIEGDENPFPRRISLPLVGTAPKASDRHLFLKARIEGNSVRLLDGQSSAMLRSFALADALVSLPPREVPAEEGEWVDVDLLNG